MGPADTGGSNTGYHGSGAQLSTWEAGGSLGLQRLGPSAVEPVLVAGTQIVRWLMRPCNAGPLPLQIVL